MHETRPGPDRRTAAHRRATMWRRRAVTSLVLPLAGVCLSMSALYGAGRLALHLARPDDHPQAKTASVAGSGRGDGVIPRGRPPVRPGREDVGREARGHWARVLRALDHRRADAWRRGRSALLARLYMPASDALRRDTAMLDAYATRGFRVSGASVLFMRVTLTDHVRRSVTLQTVDRLRPATAKLGGGRSVVLPRDRPSHHIIVLERRPGGEERGPPWRIASVRAL
jgi:hypothetical protein